MSPTYEEFDALVGRLKRATIDAYMADSNYQVVGGIYRKSAEGCQYEVGLPGADGSGGGEGTFTSTGMGTEPARTAVIDVRAQFDQLRAKIDVMVEPWSFLPVTSSLSDLAAKYEALNSRLASRVQFDSGNGQVYGAGIIASNMEHVQANASSFTGRSAEHFKSEFLWRVGAVGEGIWAISLLGTAMARATSELWKATQQDVADILDQARVAMDACAVGDDHGKAFLRLVGIVVEVAKEFLTKPLTVVLGAIGIVVDLANEATPPAEEVKFGGADYAVVLGHVEAALTRVNEQLTFQEKLIESTLQKNLEIIQPLGRAVRRPGQDNAPVTRNPFDLQVPPISSTDGITITSYGLLAGIWQECLPTVAQEYEQATVDLRFTMVYRILIRSNGIGYLPSGLDKLGRLIDELSQDLAWDIRLGAKDLELLVKAMQEHDEASAKRLRDFAKKMSTSSPHDPRG